MKHTRRNLLRKVSTLPIAAYGLSGIAAATDCSSVPAYDTGTSYSGGDQVTYDGALWTAEWWTKDTAPATSENVWTKQGDCGSGGGDGGGSDGGDGGAITDCSGVPAYDSGTAYSGGDQVTYDGSLWTAEWWTKGTAPSASANVWTNQGDCGSGGGGGGGGNTAPSASFTASPTSPAPGASVTFDAAASVDPDGSIASYEWAFGDGSSGSGETASHAYDATGDYTVTLTVTDDAGATAATTSTVTVGDTGGGGGGGDVSADTTLAEFYAEYDKDFYPAETEGGVPGLLKNELPSDASEHGVDLDAIQNNAENGTMELAALGGRGLGLVQRFTADGVPRETTARIMPWLTTLPEGTEPIPFNDGSGRDGGLTADTGPVSATNDPSVFVQPAWPSGDQFDDVYHQSQRSDWSSGVSDSQYTNTDNPIIDATTKKVHPVTGESLGSGFTANAPLEATAELHGGGWLFDQSLIFENTSDVPLLTDGAIVWWVGPSKGGRGLSQFSYDNAQRKNFSVGHPQRDVIEVDLPAADKPGPFAGTDAPLSAYGVRIAQHNNPYMYRTCYPNQKFSMTYHNCTGPDQYDWPVQDLVDVMLETTHVEFRERMSSTDQNTELVATLDMKNRYGN